jgi:hypothetical protein
MRYSVRKTKNEERRTKERTIALVVTSFLFFVLSSSFLVLSSSFLVPLAAQQMPDISQMAGTPLGAPELPDGTISVRVLREQLGNNITDHEVTLKGAQVSKTARTDAQGRATFTGIEPGTVVVATTTVDGEALQSQEFDIPAKGGVRVALVSGLKGVAERERAAAEAGAKEPPRPGMVVFGGESRVIFEFQDDNLNAFYILDVINGARTPIDTGAPLVIELPSQATGASALEGNSRLAAVNGRRVTITGPLPPGTTPVQVAFTLPHTSDTLTIEQPWPAAMEQLFVAVEQVGTVKLSSPQLPQQQEADASGTKFIMARGGRMNANQPFTLTLSGLPHADRTLRNVGIVAALLIIGIAFWAAFTAAPSRRGHDAELQTRREKLYRDLVELEQQHQAGRVNDKHYATKRQTLLAQLERVLGELDRSPSSGGEGVAA